eukprot:scaffold1245_cov122-Isochrysis_galbana.AAC.5
MAACKNSSRSSSSAPPPASAGANCDTSRTRACAACNTASVCGARKRRVSGRSARSPSTSLEASSCAIPARPTAARRAAWASAARVCGTPIVAISRVAA